MALVWLPGLCGNRSIYNAFWSTDLTLNTNNPDLTLCFQRTILVLIPFGFFFLAAIGYGYYLTTIPYKKRLCNYSKLNFSKWVLSVLLCAIILLQIIFTIYNEFSLGHFTPPVDYFALAIKLFGMILVSFFIRWEYRKGINSSGPLSIFWLLLVFVEVVPVRSLTIRTEVMVEDPKLYILYMIYYTLACLEFVLGLFADNSVHHRANYAQAFNIKAHNSKNGHLGNGLASNEFYTSKEDTPLLANDDDKESYEDWGNKPNPELTSSFWIRASFLWMTKAIIRGYKKPFVFEDLYNLRPVDTCRDLLKTFYRCGYPDISVNKSTSEKASISNKYQTSFTWALLKAVGPVAVGGTLMRLMALPFIFMSPQVLRFLISYVETQDPYLWKGVFISLSLFVLCLIKLLLVYNFLHCGSLSGLRARSIVNAMIYRKALRLSIASRRAITVGEIINFVSVDAQKVQECFTFVNLLWLIPFEIIIVQTFLYFTFGPISLSGLAVFFILVPINSLYLAKKVHNLQREQMSHKDNRLKTMNEVLSGIKILKLYAWEPSYEEKVLGYRNKELVKLKWANIINGISSGFYFMAPYLVSLVTFGSYVLMSPNNVLDADKAFVSLSLINMYGFTVTYLPISVHYVAQAAVSMKRMSKFMELEEIGESEIEQDPCMKEAIRLENCSYTWDKNIEPSLSDINLNVYKGELIAVVGMVGSGKSSLLNAMLGEMEKVSGTIKMNGRIAYVPQQAWIQNCTVRDNILFGKDYHTSMYQDILEQCALKQDLSILPGGDQTEIGEKGINLSGGQKQRVSLARAVYQNQDIYLLDDPLSAVDAHVGKHIFDRVIGPKGLLRNKTRILVTHGISYLPQCDKVVVMVDGKISEVGKYQELVENDGNFAEFLRNFVSEEIGSSEEDELKELQRQLSALSGAESDIDWKGSGTQKITKRRKKKRTGSSGMLSDDEMIKKQISKEDTGTKLIEEEISEIGAVKSQVIKAFCKAGGLLNFNLVVWCHLAFIAAKCMTDIWLSEWSNDLVINGTMDQDLVNLRLGVYGGLGATQSVFVGIGSIGIAVGCVYASKFLHEGILGRMLKAPMAFFDTTPLGRIMNRFSKDLDVVDSNLAMYIRSWLHGVAPLISTLIIISYATPIFIAVVIPFGIIYVVFQRIYISSIRQLKRIDSVRRSPIYALLDESIVGAASIRAYKREESFIKRCDFLIDESQRPWFMVVVSQRWLGVVMEFMGAFVVFFASLFAILQRENINAGLAGLSVSYALQVTTLLNTAIRTSTELETYMVSVERIKEYSEVETEAEWRIKDIKPPHDWPQNGIVQFQNYGTRYRPGLDLVLDGLDCEIKINEKIGIVGRTGAGKSSMALAIFRLIESAQGRIKIDGRTIADLGLHDLREKLTIIPQDPVVFSGSLRVNLDPFFQYSDEKVWTALEHAHLKGFVVNQPEGLHYECGEGGESLSVGQRQLLCLARALLRHTKILILDEATAAVDLETDALIQNTIRTQFNDSTILTIAHRLNTVMDYDRIMVLDKGKIKEFDSPTNLLNDKKGIFYSLAQEAGIVEKKSQ